MTRAALVLALAAAACGEDTPNDGVPVVDGQSITTAEDTPVTFLLAASDPDGKPLTITFTPPSHGTVRQDYRTFTYTPVADYHGPDAIAVTVADSKHMVSATIMISVTAVNDAPVALDDAAATVANEAAVIPASALLANDTDVDGDTLTVISVSSPNHGTVVLANDIVTFTPAPSFVGDATFRYTVSDGTASDTATVTVHVGTDNGAPLAGDDMISTAEDTPATVTAEALLANDSDPEGQMLSLTAVAAATHGTVALSAGSITFTPDPDFNGTATFQYLVTDGAAASTGHVAVTVTPAADRPVALANTITTNESTDVTITLTGSDADGDALTFAIDTPPATGSLSAITPLSSTTASVTYTPAPGATADDSFTFTVSDATATSDPAIVAIDIVAVDDAPTATPGNTTTDEDTPVTITLTGSDPEGGPLTFAIATPPAHGSLGLISAVDASSATVVYTPDANSTEADSFTFTVDDGNSTSSPATISIDVTPANDAPVATATTATVAEDSTVVITLTGSDVDGDVLTFASDAQPTHGTLGPVLPTGPTSAMVIYTPAPDATGPDSFTFTASDGATPSDPALVEITITPVNDAPGALPGTVTTDEDTPITITLSGSDVDGDALTFSIASSPTTGTLGQITQQTRTTATVTYTAATNSHASDSFTFTVSDGTVVSTAATISINVTAVNDPPVAVAASATTNEDTAVLVTLTGSDIDGDTLTFSIVGQPATGTLGPITPVDATSATVLYTPANNVNGDLTFTFRASDASASSDPATATIHITAVNDAPVATARTETATEDTPLTITLTGADVDGNGLTFAITTPPAHGTLSTITPVDATSATVIYTPNQDSNEADSFEFAVNDGTVASTPAQVSITISPVNDEPVADADNTSTNEDVPVTITLTGSDIENSPLTFAIGTPPAHGTLSAITPVNGTSATVVYTPNQDVSGTDSFTVTVNDGALTSAPAQITIDVLPAGDAPTATAGTASTNEDTAVTITLTGADPESDPLTFAAMVQPLHGTLSTITQVDATSATVVYTPNLDYNGPDQFTFVSSDGTDSSLQAAIDIAVAPVDDPPTATDGSASTTEDTPITITLHGTEVDGEALTFTIVTPPGQGALGTITPVDATSATVVYTPASDTSGTDSFTFEVNDGHTTVGPATVTVTVGAVDDPPTATAGITATTDEDTSVVINLSGSDAESATLTFAATSPSAGTLSAITVDSATTAHVTYTPNPNTNGDDTFTFTVNDGNSDSDPATVTVHVTAVNDPPVAADITDSTPDDTAITLTLTATDIDSSALTFEIVTPPGVGTVSPPVQATPTSATVTYTPVANSPGDVAFTYRALDGDLAPSAPATVTIHATAVNDAPTASPGSQTILEDTPTVITLAGVDADDDLLTFAVVSPPQGSLTGLTRVDNTHVEFTYTPVHNSNAADSFTFTVDDGSGASAAATFSLTITPVNDAPEAGDNTGTTGVDIPFVIAEATLVGVVTDVDGPSLNITAVGNPVNGTVAISGGNVTFTPTSGFTGTASFDYTVSDGEFTDVGTITVSVTNAVCGNGVTQPGETCDDNNGNSGDGCSAACTTEAGYGCSGAPSVCTTTCGDGIVAGTETCDDGGTTNGNGCSATCTVEVGYTCAGAPSVCSATCGDGILVGAEACDDGNGIGGDGCSSCTVDHGFTCAGAPSSCTATCGDGVVASTEACDDGGTTSGNGCSAACTIEAGFICTGEPSTCTASCGNGSLDAGETCDDGDTDPGDGCSAACAVETGFNCTGAPSTCIGICGDGLIRGAEACDDSNTTAGDGCSAACAEETGWDCTGEPSACGAICGDSIVVGNEECDDGSANTDENDGCTTQCVAGQLCDASNSSLGGGVRFATDPANGTCYAEFESSADYSTAAAACVTAGGHLVSITSAGEQTLVASVQNPVLQTWIGATDLAVEGTFRWETGESISGYNNFASGEPSDGGGAVENCLQMLSSLDAGAGLWNDFTCGTSLPSYICELAANPCGDGVVQAGETCDDGNDANDDGCSSTCAPEIGWNCSGQPSVCTPICGDGEVHGTEQCDDNANGDNNDGCTDLCVVGLDCSTNNSALTTGVAFATEPATGHCYAMFSNGLDWAGAQADCVGRGGYLQTVTSSTERDLVRSVWTAAGGGGSSEPWLGATDSLVQLDFRWVTGEAFGFTDFVGGEPSDSSGAEDCLYMLGFGGNQWNDGTCARTDLPRICELEVNHCGDGVVQAGLGEQCDDRNLVDGDGCSSICETE